MAGAYNGRGIRCPLSKVLNCKDSSHSCQQIFDYSTFLHHWEDRHHKQTILFQCWLCSRRERLRSRMINHCMSHRKWTREQVDRAYRVLPFIAVEEHPNKFFITGSKSYSPPVNLKWQVTPADKKSMLYALIKEVTNLSKDPRPAMPKATAKISSP